MAVAEEHAGGTPVVRLVLDGGGGGERVFEEHVSEATPRTVRSGTPGFAVEGDVRAAGPAIGVREKIELVTRIEESVEVESLS